MVQGSTILIVDDEPDVREVLEEYLAGQGYTTLTAESAEQARKLAAGRPIDLALLDIRMPGEDGLSLARRLRERYRMGIVMLTSSGTVIDRILGLEMGADDYVPKPFDPRELLARIKSVLRRTASSAELGAERVRFGRCACSISPPASSRTRPAKKWPCPHLEFDLLKAFAKQPNRVLSREQILNLSEQRDWDPFDRSVDLRILRLRRKVEPDPEHPQLIRTVRGGGYMFVPVGGGE